MSLKGNIRKLKEYIKTPKNSRKPKLLIVGKDLKFILYAVKYLEKYYEIKINDLSPTNGAITDETKELSQWADIIFCEWFERYSIWLSHNLRDDQKLFIRAHKYEILRDYGYKINEGNVDGFITVNYFFAEIFSNMFNIPREKMHVINNVVETSIYKNDKTPDYRKHIALIGYSPEYKGYKRALEILKILKDHDDGFKLYLNGHDWREMKWLDMDVVSKYYGDCDDFIEENNLNDSVINRGWTERAKMFSDIGYVLSVSDVESTHLSPVEGMADAAIACVLNWPSAEYIFPDEIIFDNLEDMADCILETYDDEEKYMQLADKCRQMTVEEFGEEKFTKEIRKVLENDRKTLNSDDATHISFTEFREKYLDDDNTINEEKLLSDFKNSYIIHEEGEIGEVLSKNKDKKTILFLSDEIRNDRIKNIHQKYASEKVLVLSLYFFTHIEEIERFYYLMGKFSDVELELK